MTQVLLMLSVNTVIHSITFEQHEQMNDPLLPASEFSLFQVGAHLLLILLRVEVYVSPVN